MKKRLFGLLGLLLILCMLASCAAEGGGLETTGDAGTVTDAPDGTTDGDATELPDGETGATDTTDAGGATTGDETPPVAPPDGVLEFSLLADGTYAVVGMGAEVSGECLVIPETVGGIPVTAIGENAFAGRREIFEVVIPATVQTIEKGAFAGCTSLWEVKLPEGLSTIEPEVFLDCTSLVRVFIPASVTLIAARAFRGCTSIAEVISESALPITAGRESYGYVALHALSVHMGETRIVEKDGFFFHVDGMEVTLVGAKGAHAAVSLILPSSFEGTSYAVGAYAFDALEKLEAVTVPVGVSAIEAYAFAGCTELTRASVSSPQISAHAFEKCTALAVLNLFEGVTSIGDYAFDGCCALVSLDLPESLTALGESAFRECHSLVSVTVPSGVEVIPLEAFRNCDALERVVIGEGALSVGQYAFRGCERLASVALPSTLTQIGEEAFYGCDSLIREWENGFYVGSWLVDYSESARQFVLRDGTVGVASGAFDDCGKLGVIDFPEGVRAISPYALRKCAAYAVVLPRSVEHAALTGYSSLLSVYYAGDGAAWEAVDATLPDEFCTVYFYSETATEGNYWHYDGTTPVPCYTRPATESLSYKLLDNGTYAVVGLTKQEYNVVIPSHHEGIAVTEVHSLTPYNATVSSLTLPETVVDIYDYLCGTMPRLAEIINRSRLRFAYSYESGYIHVEEQVAIHKGASRVARIGDFVFYHHEKDTVLVSYLGTDVNVVLPTLESGTSYRIGNYALANSYRYHNSDPLYPSAQIESVVIPEGVTEIAADAFYFTFSLSSVTLPDSLEKIGARAFCGSALRSLTLPKKLTEIGTGAFTVCYELAEVINRSKLDVVRGSAEHGDVAAYADVVHSDAKSRFFTVGDYLFLKTDGDRAVLCGYEGTDTELTLPATADGLLYDIRIRAFYANHTLTRVVIPEGVQSIGENAFRYCEKLQEVVLPSSLQEIGDYAFYHCESLTEISIPAGVKSIPDRCFASCESLTLVVLPEGVEKIGDLAFSNCKALEILVIPTSVTHFGRSIVDGCSALKGFYYMGNSEQWKKISEDDSYYFNGPLLGLTLEKYYYAESDPADGGKYWHWDEDGMPVEYAP